VRQQRRGGLVGEAGGERTLKTMVMSKLFLLMPTRSKLAISISSSVMTRNGTSIKDTCQETAAVRRGRQRQGQLAADWGATRLSEDRASRGEVGSPGARAEALMKAAHQGRTGSRKAEGGP
jgi:hypothetical protein